MAKLPAALQAPQLTKNKANLAKLQKQIPNLGNKLLGIATDAGSVLDGVGDYASMFGQDKIGSLDPLAFAERHKKAQGGGTAVLNAISAVEKSIAEALKSKDIAKDKKAVAYGHELESALLTLRASVRTAERGSDDMAKAYKSALKKSQAYSGIVQNAGEAPTRRQALLTALANIRQQPTVDYMYNTLTGGQEPIARSYSTACLGTFVNVQKHMPKLAKSLYPGDAKAVYLDKTLIDLAANKKLEFRAVIEKSVADAGDEAKGVRAVCDTYEKQVKRADALTKLIVAAAQAVQKAAT